MDQQAPSPSNHRTDPAAARQATVAVRTAQDRSPSRARQQQVLPLIHTGYHKTGTTWLQQLLFVNTTLGFASPFDSWKEVARVLVVTEALDFDAAVCRQYFAARIKEAQQQGLVPVLSCERLSGNPHSGGYDSKEIAERLAAVFPEARILMGIREQKAMILSTYKEYVRGGGARSLKAYLHPVERGAGTRRVPMFSFNHFKFHRLIGYYQTLFGKDNVLVLPYESFRDEPDAFIRSIIRFVRGDAATVGEVPLPFSEKRNAAFSGVTAAVKRQMNRFLIEDVLNPGAPFSISKRWERRVMKGVQKLEGLVPQSLRTAADQQLRKTVETVVGNRYQESNRHTERLTGLDLAAYGYDV